MTFQIFINELRRNKVINIILFAFIMLASLLAASAANVMIMLMGSVDMLMESCITPHFVQMHKGAVNDEELEEFNNQFNYIEDFQLMETICIDGGDLSFNNSSETEAESVMDISFVVQNNDFDFLLDTDNEIVIPEAGEVAVPIYYKGQNDLDIGDILTLSSNGNIISFQITAFVRDSQMNPSLVSSKRFVVSKDDHYVLSDMYTEREYLIEYRFDNIDRIDEFASEYTASSMPQTGPAVDYTLFRMLNALTDGIIVLVLVLVSVLLIVIGMLCLRFTLLGAIEEDTREIGVMKAIGLPLRMIKHLYMSKYILLSCAACTAGYFLSFAVNGLFTRGIAQYMGAVAPEADTYILTALSSAVVLALVIISCYILLNRFKKLSAVKALTSRMGEERNKKRNGLCLRKSVMKNTNIFLGINAVYSNMKVYLVLGVIFIISTFIVIVPVNLLNTISSNDFVNYMGVGSSHLRIDVRTEEGADENTAELIKHIKNDDEIKQYGIYKTYRASMTNPDGEAENVPLEIGDFSLFPLDYIDGIAPTNDNEIALSVLTADSIDKKTGDEIEISCGYSKYNVKITGIYQDVTNGGKTAKASVLEPDADTLWYVVNLDVKDGSDAKYKADYYTSKFNGIKVTHLEEYLDQTLGSTISQLRLVTIAAVVVAMSIASLISALFIKMMLSKERRQIAILKSIGFNQDGITMQYITRIFVVFIVGIVLGIILSSTVGEALVGMVYANFGAPGIEFVVNPFVSYALCPLLLGIAALMTGYIVISRFKPSNISRMIIE